MVHEIIAVGASLGGLDATQILLRALPLHLSLPAGDRAAPARRGGWSLAGAS